MNYEYQFPGIDTDCVPGGDGVLSYSVGKRAPLNEAALNESKGICKGVAVDWNQNGVIDSSNVSADINPWPNGGDGATGTLTDFNDWAHLNFHGLSDADATQTQASGSLAGALQAAAALPGRTGAALATGAQHAFVDGVHLAAIVGVLLAAVAAAVVLRFLPGETSHQAEVDAEPLPADTDDEVDDLVLATEELSA